MFILNNSNYLFNIIMSHLRKCIFTFSPIMAYSCTDMSNWKWGRLFIRGPVRCLGKIALPDRAGKALSCCWVLLPLGVIILIHKTGSRSVSHDRLGHCISRPNLGSQPDQSNLCCLLAMWHNRHFTFFWLTYLNTLKYSFEAYKRKIVLNLKCSTPIR